MVLRKRGPMNVGQILTLTANKFPDRIAIVFENQRSTYQMFNDRVNRLSLALFHMGLSKRGKVPALLFHPSAFIETKALGENHI